MQGGKSSPLRQLVDRFAGCAPPSRSVKCDRVGWPRPRYFLTTTGRNCLTPRFYRTKREKSAPKFAIDRGSIGSNGAVAPIGCIGSVSPLRAAEQGAVMTRDLQIPY